MPNFVETGHTVAEIWQFLRISSKRNNSLDDRAEDRVQSGSADIQSPQHLDAVVPATPNPGSRTRPQPAIDHYDAVSTFHNDDFCEARLPMLCSGSLELTTENCSQ